MRVGADLHRARGLPLVAEGVHVADDRVVDLGVGLDEHVDRADIGHLVHGGHEGDGGAGHVGDAVRPAAAGDDDVLGLDATLVGHDGGDALATGGGLVDGLEGHDLGVGEHLEVGLVDGLVAEDRPGVEGVDDRHRGAVEAPEDDLLVDEGDELLDLGGAEELGVDSPGAGAGHAALQFLPALLGAGDLDAAGVDAALYIAVLVRRLHAEEGHLLVVVDREDEVGGVAGGAAGVGERALVEEDHVLPSEPGQVPGEAVADDAGADDHALGVAGNGVTHGNPPVVVESVSGLSYRTRWVRPERT